MSEYIFGSFLNSLDNIRYNVLNVLNDIKIDDNYIRNIRSNIKTKMDILIDKCLPPKIIEDKRFIVIIEKKKNYDNFRCPICMLILYKPVKTECSHIFCRECIEKVLKKFDYCPMCRNKIKNDDLENVSINSLGNEYENIKIRCPNCRNITTVKDYEYHLINEFLGNNNNNNEDKLNLHRKNLQEVCNLSDKNLDFFFNKKLKIEEMNELILFLSKNKLDNTIRSFNLLYVEKKKSEYLFKNSQIEEIICEIFLIVKVKKKKRKEEIAYKLKSLYNDKKLSKNYMKRDHLFSYNNNNEEEKKISYVDNDICKRRSYSFENYELYQEEMIKKNKENKYMFVMFEYNSENLFFTLFNNFPNIKNLRKIKLVTYKKLKNESKNNYKVNELIEFLSKLKIQKNSKTYHKYFYSSLHLFHEVIFSYIKNGYFLKKKEYHFKNNYIRDYELMFLFFYLKYEYKIPNNIEYHLLYSEEFITKILKDQSCDQTVFISNIYTYKMCDNNNDGNKESKSSHLNKNKNDLNIRFIVKIQNGKLKSKLNEKEKSEKSSILNNIENYQDINDICFFIFSYSSHGFQWDIKKSINFLIKKKIVYKSVKVFFDIDKLILFFFHIRNKKYNSIFWNSTHFLQYMLNFCCN
ncbi:RING zinc finger protein, putative [Plasmodium relictum]|uniref:RING zinc finger protein, putative n=1 Tax=Plasmodium relictum TaxID=85471 RepID=A0A1J1H202_PLARL|nr:RING zinc finger protein, putative [Plasmodium relictum]CRG98952.1 RING zinc finger protein, putative [Plasmodium relictum]